MVRNVVAFAADYYGPIDGFVTNASTVGRLGAITHYADDVFDQITSANVRGTFLPLKCVAVAARRCWPKLRGNYGDFWASCRQILRDLAHASTWSLGWFEALGSNALGRARE